MIALFKREIIRFLSALFNRIAFLTNDSDMFIEQFKSKCKSLFVCKIFRIRISLLFFYDIFMK